MSEINLQRKKVVVLAASVACMGGGSILLRGHPRFLMVWIAVMFAILVLAGVEFAKMKRQER